MLSGAHPKTTVLDLVGAEHFPDEVVEDMRRYRSRGGSVKVNWILSEPPRFEHPESDALLHTSLAICPSIDYLERAWQDATLGKPAEGPYIEVEVPTSLDPTLTDDGTTVMTMFTQYGPHDEAGWPDGAREAYAMRCLGPDRPVRAERPRRGRPLRGARAARPRADLRARRRLDLPGRAGPGPDGVHAADAAARRATRRRSHGLYLCGAGTHPGGGVIAAAGHNAAQRVLKDRRKRRLPERAFKALSRA